MIFLAYFPDLVDHFFNYTPLAISLKDDSRCGASVHRTIKPPLFKRHKFTLHGSYCLWTFHLRAYKKTWLDLISLLPKLLYIIATFFCFSEWSRAHFVHGVRVYLGTDSGIFPAALQYPSLDCISVRRSFQNPHKVMIFEIGGNLSWHTWSSLRITRGAFYLSLRLYSYECY